MNRSPCPPDMASDRGAIRTCSWWGWTLVKGGASPETPPHPNPLRPQVRPPDEPKGGRNPSRGGASKLRSFILSQPMLLHPPVERRAGEAQFGGGQRDIV